MGLFKSLQGRLGMLGAEAQQISKNGVPRISSNPADLAQSAMAVKHDVAIAGAMKEEITGGVVQVKQNETTQNPTQPVNGTPTQNSQPDNTKL